MKNGTKGITSMRRKAAAAATLVILVAMTAMHGAAADTYGEQAYGEYEKYVIIPAAELESLETRIRELEEKIMRLENDTERMETRIGNQLIYIEALREAYHLADNVVTVDLQDLTVPSNISEWQMNLLLQGTGLCGTGWYFLEAERRFGVNAVVMAAIMRQESQLATEGWIAQFNNFAGLRAHPGTPNFDGWEVHLTRRDGIFALARRLADFYLHPDAIFYIEEHGPSIAGVNIRYALDDDGNPDARWGYNIYWITRDFLVWINNRHNPWRFAHIYREGLESPFVDEYGNIRPRPVPERY